MQLPDGHSENPSSGKNSLPKRELAVRPISPTRDYLKPQCDAFLTFLFSTGFNCSLTNHLDICAWVFVTGIVCYLDCFRAVRSSAARLMQEWEFVPLALAAWDGSGRVPEGSSGHVLPLQFFSSYFFPATFTLLPACSQRVRQTVILNPSVLFCL